MSAPQKIKVHKAATDKFMGRVQRLSGVLARMIQHFVADKTVQKNTVEHSLKLQTEEFAKVVEAGKKAVAVRGVPVVPLNGFCQLRQLLTRAAEPLQAHNDFAAAHACCWTSLFVSLWVTHAPWSRILDRRNTLGAAC